MPADDTVYTSKSVGDQTSSIVLYYQNVRSIKNKLIDFYNSVEASQYFVVALTETWLDSSISDSELFSAKYNVFRKDRDFVGTGRSRGGGVLLAVDSSCQCEMLNMDFDWFRHSVKIDLVAAKLKASSKYLYIVLIYIPPDTTHDEYDEFFESLSLFVGGLDGEVLFLGDFNIGDYSSSINSNDTAVLPRVALLSHFLHMNGLEQCNFIRNSYGGILDLVICNGNCSVYESIDQFVKVDEYHPVISVTLEFSNKSKYFPTTSTNTYDFKNVDLALLSASIDRVDWTFLSDYNDINLCTEIFYRKLDVIFSGICRKKKNVYTSRRYPPWFNSRIIKNIKLKERALRKYRRLGDAASYGEFCRLRALVKRDIRISFSEYTRELEAEINSNPCRFWHYVDARRGISSIPNDMSYGGKRLTHPSDILNAFADFFTKSYSPHQCVNPLLSNTASSTSLVVDYFSEEDVLTAINKIKHNSTIGSDGIPAYILAKCANSLVVPLTLIFNLSLHVGVFPNIWKLTRVCPVHKMGPKDLITNYRPVSIICNFSKVFEFALYERIYSHVKHLIPNQQHGFMKGRSTVTNLMCATQYISECIDSQSQADVIYTDLSKAFDRLNHAGLLTKLDSFGFSKNLINFIRTYLVGRRQFVSFNGFTSHTSDVLSGVPQGSVIGPLLFNIFVADLIQVFDVVALMYADDLKLLHRIQTSADCKLLQDNIIKFHSWCTENGLQVNVDKCCSVSYTRRSCPVEYGYCIDNIPISRVNSVKDLGITFDNKLTFINHIDNVVAESFRLLGFVFRVGQAFSTPTLKALFYAFIRSKLEYACLVWMPNYEIHVNKLENIQRRFLKFMALKCDNQYPPRGFPQQMLLDRFGFTSLTDRRKNLAVKFLKKLIDGSVDCSDLLHSLNFLVPRMGARQNVCFYLPTPRTNTLKFSPIHNICTIYNDCCSSVDIFF